LEIYDTLSLATSLAEILITLERAVRPF
jgi:hypothetical protein